VWSGIKVNVIRIPGQEAQGMVPEKEAGGSIVFDNSALVEIWVASCSFVLRFSKAQPRVSAIIGMRAARVTVRIY